MRIRPPPEAHVLGAIGVDRFMRDYWQKKPLVVRQAIPGFRPLVSEKALVQLAAREEVQSRLVTCFGGRWAMQHGPLARLPKQERDWTVLVQGVNLYHSSVDRLMRRFAFVPYSRLDDVMISLAADGGGVGPHFDSYDVFLLQAQGRRRWRISAQTDLTVIDGLPLKILRHFAPQEEWVLEPGDMLYLPPHYAHDGQAIGACMTYSIGFRAPTYAELASEFLYFLGERAELRGRLTDKARKPTEVPGQFDDRLLEATTKRLTQLRGTPKDVAEFMGRFMTEPKAHVFFRPVTATSAVRFMQGVRSRGLRLDLKTQMLYRKKNIYINGEALSVTPHHARWLARLANARFVKADVCNALVVDEALVTLLYSWYCAGWIQMGGDDE